MRAYVVLATSVWLAGLLWAGGNKAEEPEGTTLSVIDQLDLTDQTGIEIHEEILAAFNKAYPDIHLEWEMVAGEEYINKLATLSVANKLPDLIRLWPFHRTGMVTTSGRAKDLRPWLKGKEDYFLPNTLPVFGKQGEIYEVPGYSTITHVMYANTDLLKKLNLTFPRTYQELLAQGPVIREAGLVPIAMSNKDGWQMQSCLLSQLTGLSGGMDWYRRALAGDGASFSDPQFVRALAVIDELTRKGFFFPDVLSAGYGSELTRFENGEAVYLIDGRWRLPNLLSETSAEQQKAVDFGVFPPFEGSEGPAGITSSVVGNGFGMSSNIDPSKEEAAWKWIWFQASPEVVQIRLNRGLPPVVKLEDSDYPDTLADLMKRFLKFRSQVPTFAYVLDAMVDAKGMAILQNDLQAMMLQQKTPQEVADNFEQYMKEFRKA